ncbi:MAG: SH3 domain-containing protein [Lewinellaceae bacterium]|nr:SH3 domain-containing protein [Lewinellaceae bacterium]
MKLKLLLPCLLLAMTLNAQDELDEYFSATINAAQENYTTLVFGDKINVREAPNTTSKVVAQLKAGDEVKIIETDTTTATFNGWTASWCKIAFAQNGRQLEGYAWSGLLSPIPLYTPDVLFVYNVTRTKAEQVKRDGYEYENLVNEVEIRAVRNGNIISSVHTTMQFDGGYETQAFSYGAQGVPNCERLLKFTFFYPACGYTSYDFWCIWDGKQLLPLPLLSSFADAGAIHENESYIFPENENGLPDQILYQYELDEGMIMDGTYDYYKHIRPMLWNGKKFVKPEIPKQ